jgi:hypothetical protein
MADARETLLWGVEVAGWDVFAIELGGFERAAAGVL